MIAIHIVDTILMTREVEFVGVSKFLLINCFLDY